MNKECSKKIAEEILKISLIETDFTKNDRQFMEFIKGKIYNFQGKKIPYSELPFNLKERVWEQFDKSKTSLEREIDEVIKNFKVKNISSTKKELSEKDCFQIIKDIFELDFAELKKNILNLKGKVEISDETYSSSVISFELKKELVDKYYGKDYDIKKIEKELSSNYETGPGRNFHKIFLTMKPKNKETYLVRIIINSGLDV